MASPLCLASSVCKQGRDVTNLWKFCSFFPSKLLFSLTMLRFPKYPASSSGSLTVTYASHNVTSDMHLYSPISLSDAFNSLRETMSLTKLLGISGNLFLETTSSSSLVNPNTWLGMTVIRLLLGVVSDVHIIPTVPAEVQLRQVWEDATINGSWEILQLITVK